MSEQGKQTDNVFCSLWTKSKALGNALSNSDKRNKKQGSIWDTQTQKEHIWPRSKSPATLPESKQEYRHGDIKRGKLPRASQRVSEFVGLQC